MEGEFLGRRSDTHVVSRGERAEVVRYKDNLRTEGDFTGTGFALCSCWPDWRARRGISAQL